MKIKGALLLGICFLGMVLCAAWAQDADTSASETLTVETPAAAPEEVTMPPLPEAPALAAPEVPIEVPAAPVPEVPVEMPVAPESAAPIEPETPAAPAVEEPVVSAPVQVAEEPVPPAGPPAVLPAVVPAPAAQLPALGEVVPAVVVMMVTVFLVVVIVFYVPCSLCLQVIAQKTNQSPAWWAWVPIANVFLMCKIAVLRYWWVLGIILVFIPFVGGILISVWNGYMWYKIALARNKPGWVGILTVIPFVNLVIMGYLAFADAPAVEPVQNAPENQKALDK